MSEENVKIVKGMYEAFGRGDIEAVIATLDPGIEWLEAESFIYEDGKPYIGPNAVLEGVFMRIATDWESFRVSPKEILDAGETVVGHGYYSGTYKKNGKQVQAQFAHLFKIRSGKVVRFQQYTDTAQFLRVVSS